MGTIRGDLVIYDAPSKAVRVKAQPAHTKGVYCLAQALLQGAPVVASGGADFQVKFWSMEGRLLTLSGHHHGAVRALLPLPPLAGPASTGLPSLWSCSDDGTIFCWSDANGDGVVDESEGRSLTSSGGKACNALLAVGSPGAEEVWAGFDDGLVCVYGREAVRAGVELRRHRAPVSALVQMGGQVLQSCCPCIVADARRCCPSPLPRHSCGRGAWPPQRCNLPRLQAPGYLGLVPLTLLLSSSRCLRE